MPQLFSAFMLTILLSLIIIPSFVALIRITGGIQIWKGTILIVTIISIRLGHLLNLKSWLLSCHLVHIFTPIMCHLLFSINLPDIIFVLWFKMLKVDGGGLRLIAQNTDILADQLLLVIPILFRFNQSIHHRIMLLQVTLRSMCKWSRPLLAMFFSWFYFLNLHLTVLQHLFFRLHIILLEFLILLVAVALFFERMSLTHVRKNCKICWIYLVLWRLCCQWKILLFIIRHKITIVLDHLKLFQNFIFELPILLHIHSILDHILLRWHQILAKTI